MSVRLEMNVLRPLTSEGVESVSGKDRITKLSPTTVQRNRRPLSPEDYVGHLYVDLTRAVSEFRHYGLTQ